MAAKSALVEALVERSKFSLWTRDTLRANDLDTQGHVNNTVFPVFFASGRYNFLQNHLRPHVARHDHYALVKITIEYLNELRFPGEVEAGTLVRAIGRSSVTIGQALFSKGSCVAVAESIVVLLDRESRLAKPWPEQAQAYLDGMARAGVVV